MFYIFDFTQGLSSGLRLACKQHYSCDEKKSYSIEISTSVMKVICLNDGKNGSKFLNFT